MPANLGYICVLLYNQNNCTGEGPTVTTSFELEIGTDLCVMMAYDKDKSMGHLVTGGSIANIEQFGQHEMSNSSLWHCREP